MKFLYPALSLNLDSPDLGDTLLRDRISRRLQVDHDVRQIAQEPVRRIRRLTNMPKPAFLLDKIRLTAQNRLKDSTAQRFGDVLRFQRFAGELPITEPIG